MSGAVTDLRERECADQSSMRTRARPGSPNRSPPRRPAASPAPLLARRAATSPLPMPSPAQGTAASPSPPPPQSAALLRVRDLDHSTTPAFSSILLPTILTRVHIQPSSSEPVSPRPVSPSSASRVSSAPVSHRPIVIRLGATGKFRPTRPSRRSLLVPPLSRPSGSMLTLASSLLSLVQRRRDRKASLAAPRVLKLRRRPSSQLNGPKSTSASTSPALSVRARPFPCRGRIRPAPLGLRHSCLRPGRWWSRGICRTARSCPVIGVSQKDAVMRADDDSLSPGALWVSQFPAQR
jgi:hypothetical protein